MDAKKLFLEYFDKLALAVAATVLVLFIVSSVKENPAEQMRAKVDKANQTIRVKIDEANLKAQPFEPSVVVREVRRALEPASTDLAQPGWVFHKKPVVVYKTEGIEIPEPKAFAPNLDQPKSGLGRITVTWSESSSDNLVKVDRYDLWRCDGELTDKGWKKIKSFDATKTSYVDTDVKPKTNYWYRLDATFSIDESQDQVVQARKKGAQFELPAEMQHIGGEPAGPITTKPDTYLKVFAVQLKSTPQDIKNGKPPQEATATVVIWRFFAERKSWEKQTCYDVKVGDTIGKPEQKGKDNLDFTTDWKLDGTRVVPKKTSGGLEATKDAATVDVIDVKTGEHLSFDNVDVDPAIPDIEKNPKVNDDADAAKPDDAGAAKKK